VNVLVVSHTYITRVGREKWRELLRLRDVRLRIIVPSVWKDYLFTLRADEQRDEELDLRPMPVCFSGKEAAHAYRTLTFGMRRFRPDILHVEEGTDAFSYAQALCARRLAAPRARAVFFTWMNFEKRLRAPFGAIERFNLRRSDAAICGNADARDILRRKGFARPIAVLPLLGIDATVFRRADASALRAELRADGPVIGFIGRFVAEKGVLDLIDAAARLAPPFTLLFVGGGAMEEAMRARARAAGIGERMRIVPPVPHAEIPRYLNAMDLLVLPSYTVPHWKEQFGQVLVQAMACEVPVLGSTHAEIPRVIGDAGLTFRERDADDLARQLALLVGEPDLRARNAEKGRARVLELYTNTRIAEQTYDIYRETLETPSR
jgi:glycosyltransferase involved in cell wall biosynthesis